MSSPVVSTPRLHLSWLRVTARAAVRVSFVWEAPWPHKYSVECINSMAVVARREGLTWDEALATVRSAVERSSGAPAAVFDLLSRELPHV